MKPSLFTLIDALADADGWGCYDASNPSVDTRVSASQAKDYVLRRYINRAASARALSNSASSQALFATGTLTLPATGIYLFEGIIAVTNMSGTSGNLLFDVKGAGTATISAWLWNLSGIDAATLGTLVDLDSPFLQTSASAQPAVTAGTGATIRLNVKGSFDCTAVGTVIPSITLANANAAQLVAGSYIMFQKVLETATGTAGPWS